MKQIMLLDNTDIVLPTDWCRPLSLTLSKFGALSEPDLSSKHLGTPINNTKWVQAAKIFDPAWFEMESTVQSFSISLNYEFVRGDIPESHQLDIARYNTK